MNSMELLEVGARVRVQNKIGNVVKAKMVQGYPSGIIALHTIKYTHRYIYRSGNQPSKIEPMEKPSIANANYSFIERF